MDQPRGVVPKKNGGYSDMRKGAEESIAKLNSKNIVVTKMVLWITIEFDMFKKIILSASKNMDTQSFFYYPEPQITGGKNKSTIYFINSKMKEEIPHTLLGCDYFNCIMNISDGVVPKIKFKVYEFQDKPKCVGFFHWKSYDFYQKSLVRASNGKIVSRDVEKLTGEELSSLAKDKGVVVTSDAYGTFYKTAVKDHKLTIQKLAGPISIDKIDKLREFLVPS